MMSVILCPGYMLGLLLQSETFQTHELFNSRGLVGLFELFELFNVEFSQRHWTSEMQCTGSLSQNGVSIFVIVTGSLSQNPVSSQLELISNPKGTLEMICCQSLPHSLQPR